MIVLPPASLILAIEYIHMYTLPASSNRNVYVHYDKRKGMTSEETL